MPNTQVSQNECQEEYHGFQLSLDAELELICFKATHSLHSVDDSLRKSFKGYMSSDDIEDDDRRERETVFDDIESLRRLLRILL